HDDGIIAALGDVLDEVIAVVPNREVVAVTLIVVPSYIPLPCIGLDEGEADGGLGRDLRDQRVRRIIVGEPLYNAVVLVRLVLQRRQRRNEVTARFRVIRSFLSKKNRADRKITNGKFAVPILEVLV